ncbi:AbrB/MazE/SpoVT family DNA-binding domain-containing protein [Thiocystis minor]|uniref:AbrB/MazE/SpoVT family DNA-binding domain-containing protein n=1 Tax=Thiocystis minor TaxID=61597 RepID=UPI0019133ED0|nr:AbrB/MazE/SpoVT family DNA-binding domain-containing protein [Thiocystis minor]MBK5964455.1 AbrB/MazE/SpoVT family DNA-binding domain-containing protein [Thiocystis minor]
MKIHLVPIGNSKGVRIPASVIKECGFGDALEMRVENGVVVLAAARQVRAGWDAAFASMAVASDDAPLVLETLENDFDVEDWTW